MGENEAAVDNDLAAAFAMGGDNDEI